MQHVRRQVLALALALGAIAPAALHAQEGAGATPPADSVQYLRARAMVSNGDAAGGRRLVDSLLKASQPGTAAYAEGLYWRGTLSASATSAERDYRQIVVDYPLSPRVPEALLRLGQLESARGDRTAALQHFQRINLEHPDSRLHAEASYWIARMDLEANQLAQGCAANADALAHVNPSDVELKNRIEYQNLRCRGVVVAVPPTSEGGAPVAAVPSTVPSTALSTAPSTPSAAASPASAPRPAPVIAPPKVTRAVPVYPGSSAAPVAHRAERAPTPPARVAERVTPTATHASSTAPGSVTTGETHRGYAVQVGAYSKRGPADALAAKLRARGYPSHVDGMAAPFRVRIGHYSTHAAAAAELARLRGRKINGFIAEY